MAPLTALSIVRHDEPTGEMEVDYDKNVTRLYESISDSDWDTAIVDVKEHPNEARTWVVRHHQDGDQDGIMWRFLPIHSACARQPPETVISVLLEAYPDGARCIDDQGMLPIHYACGNQASIEVIRFLLLAFPESSYTADPNGMLPIHYIAQWGPSTPSVINILLFSNQNIAEARDLDGKTPLDLAREGDYPEKDAVIMALEEVSRGYQESGDNPANEQQQEPVVEEPRVMLEKEKDAQNTYSHGDNPATEVSTTSVPKTSEAVRRLQEAANAQQRAREDHIRRQEMSEGRDAADTSSVNRSVYTPSPVEDTRSFSRSVADDMSVNTAGASTMKMVASLKAEVNKLREEAAAAETEAERKIEQERQEMQKALDEMNEKLAKTQHETMESLAELTAKEEFGQYVETRLQDKENELESAMKKNENIRQDLAAMKAKVAEYKEKSEKLTAHLSTLSHSMSSMTKEQEMIMKASIRHEEHMKKVAVIRQQKMQELIDQEVQFAKMSLEKQKQSDLGSEELINKALSKQKDLMSSIVEVLKESDQK